MQRMQRRLDISATMVEFDGNDGLMRSVHINRYSGLIRVFRLALMHSFPIRWRVVQARFENEPWSQIARRFFVPVRTCMHFWKLYMRYGAPMYPFQLQSRRGRRALLNDEGEATLLWLLEVDSNLCLDDLAELMGMAVLKNVSVGQVLRALKVRVFKSKSSSCFHIPHCIAAVGQMFGRSMASLERR